MQFDWKTFDSVLVAGIPALILAIGAGLTAYFITRKIEKMKLDAQNALERERMEFQRDAERQEQQMELYKTLYIERISAVKVLNEKVAALGDRCLIWTIQSHDATKYSGNWRAAASAKLELDGHVQLYRWLYTDAVVNAVNAMGSLFADCWNEPIRGKDAVGPSLEDMQAAREMIIKAASNMMLNEDLSRLVNR